VSHLVGPESGCAVSLVVPGYNSAAWVDECLASLVAQSSVDLEIVCVDDGSSDATGVIMELFASIDERVRVIHQANAGLASARNTGLTAARGTYVAFVDSDDYYRFDALAHLVEHADREALDVLMFDAVPFRDAGVSSEAWLRFSGYYGRSQEYLETRPGASLLADMRRNADYRSNANLYLVRRAFLTAIDLEFVPGIVHEDEYFTFAMILAAERAAHMAMPLFARRVRADSIMTAGAPLKSAQGYLQTYVEMLRLVAGRSFGAEVDGPLASIVSGIWNACVAKFVESGQRVDPDPGFSTIDSLVARNVVSTAIRSRPMVVGSEGESR